MFDWLWNLFNKKKIDSIIKPTPKMIITSCQFKNCGALLKGLDHYVCRYCGKHHCSLHRIAEDHGCNPLVPP